MTKPWVGQSLERFEDAALLTGRGGYFDDLGGKPGTLHAALLRSPHGHADIAAIDVAAARRLPGVACVITGADLADITTNLVASVRAPIDARAIATDRVRYVGEPVAVVVATDRYIAEDAVELIELRYRTQPAVVDPQAALADGAPLLHDRLANNLASDRAFSYGDPDTAFAAAPHRRSVTIHYPRNTGSPIETYGVLAEYDPHGNSYDILANFQGPFSIHAVISRALKVAGNRLRLRLRLRLPRDSGGSFGVKRGVAPYIVLIAAAARIAGRPVKWVEDRLEHLAGAVSATNRVTTLAAAFDQHGRVTAFLNLVTRTPYQTSALLLVGANVAAAIGAPLFGELSQHVGRKPVLLWSGILRVVAFPFLFLTMAHTTSLTTLTLCVLALAFLANGSYGPILIFLNEHFPTEMRASGTGLSWNVGFALGGMMPTVVSLFATTPAALPMVLAVATAAVSLLYVAGALIIPETKGALIRT